MKLEKRVLEIEFEDKKMELKFPTVLQIKKMTKKQQNLNDPLESIDIILELLQNLGMDKDIAEALEHRHLEAIMEVLLEQKK